MKKRTRWDSVQKLYKMEPIRQTSKDTSSSKYSLYTDYHFIISSSEDELFKQNKLKFQTAYNVKVELPDTA